MKIEVSPAAIEDKSLLQRMMQFYLYDFSEFGNSDLWRKVLAEYTGGRYLETNLNNELWKGPIQSFDKSI